MTIEKTKEDLIKVLKLVLQKRTERAERYAERQEELLKRCRECNAGKRHGPWYCEDCTTGYRLHMLDAEYSDIYNWWSPEIANYIKTYK